MPLDCLPVSHTFCVPPAYEEVWMPGGLTVRVNDDKTPYVITDAMIARVGARVASLNTDVSLPVKPDGFEIRDIGDIRLYYRSVCTTPHRCVFEAAAVLPEQRGAVERYGIDAEKLEIVGADGAGLDRALRSISVIQRSAKGEQLTTLAELMPGR